MDPPSPEQRNSSKRSRPCDACRRRKNKCVTEAGNHVCILCKLHGQACTYDEEVPRRVRRPLDIEDTAPMSQPARKRIRPGNTKPGTGVEEYDNLPGPSLLKRTLGLQNRHHSEVVGPNAVPDVYGLLLQAPNAPRPRHEGIKDPYETIRFVHPNLAFRVMPDDLMEEHGRPWSAIDNIEATALGNGSELVTLYFRIVHPSFPILHKDVFLEKYERSYREFSPPLLAAVYLLASTYWSFSDALATAEKVSIEALQKLAFATLQDTLSRPKLSTIQAGLLLCQYQKAFTGAVPPEQRDRLNVQLVSAAHRLGLHLDCTMWEIPHWEISLRRRIGWALYIQDKWMMLLDGRPALISYDDWDVPCLIDDDFPEHAEDDSEGSSEVQKGRLVFMSMAQLSLILQDILRTLFSARAQRALHEAPDKLTRFLEQMKPLQIQLREWFTKLPESLRMETATSMKLSSVGYLRLAYLTVEVCIHRQVLKYLSMTEGPDKTMAQACRNAASERFHNATEFVRRLQVHHLAAFWFFGSSKCCALIHAFGTALELMSNNADERAIYARKLKEYKWALKVNSEAGASFMTQALSLINLSVLLVAQSSELVSPTSSPAVVTSESFGGVPQQGDSQIFWDIYTPEVNVDSELPFDMDDGMNGDVAFPHIDAETNTFWQNPQL